MNVIVAQPSVKEVEKAIETMDMNGQFNALINYFPRLEQLDLMIRFQTASRIEDAECRQKAQARVIVHMWAHATTL